MAGAYCAWTFSVFAFSRCRQPHYVRVPAAGGCPRGSGRYDERGDLVAIRIPRARQVAHTGANGQKRDARALCDFVRRGGAVQERRPDLAERAIGVPGGIGSGSLIAQPNYRYVCDVKNPAGTTLARLKCDKLPTTNFGFRTYRH